MLIIQALYLVMLPQWLTKAIQQQADSSWHMILLEACAQLEQSYLEFLTTHVWLPGANKIFAAFTLPHASTQFILYGESPYPRQISANGYAFWDAAVEAIWRADGLSKTVNRATSLRNFLKMLCLVETGEDNRMNAQEASAKHWVKTLPELFENFLRHGFLLLNFNLSLSVLAKNQEAVQWQKFHQVILDSFYEKKPTLVLLGKIAERVLSLSAASEFSSVIAEHPYNLSFIHNPQVIDFFKPLHLLRSSHSLNQINVES